MHNKLVTHPCKNFIRISGRVINDFAKQIYRIEFEYKNNICRYSYMKQITSNITILNYYYFIFLENVSSLRYVTARH